MTLRLILVVFLCLANTILFSQVEEEMPPPDYIKTIVFKGNTQESQIPIIKLGDYLSLEFDALNGDEADFYYKIEHFNFDWTPSKHLKNWQLYD